MTELQALIANTGIANFELGALVMIAVCGLLLYLAIAKEFEPLLLLPLAEERRLLFVEACRHLLLHTDSSAHSLL